MENKTKQPTKYIIYCRKSSEQKIGRFYLLNHREKNLKMSPKEKTKK